MQLSAERGHLIAECYPLSRMAQRSPTIEGFRAAFRRPGVVIAEITWRWVFGAAVLTLLTLSFFEFLDTLPVSKADLFLLRSNQPFLVSQAIGHILHGSAATVEGLLDYFGWNEVGDPSSSRVVESNRSSPRRRFGSLLGLNFLRVA